MDWLSGVLGGGFMPHGACYLWQPGVLWLNVGSDAAIALAYYSIPIAITAFVVKRPGVSFGWLFWMFSAFIFLCGTTHAFGVWTVWSADYFVEGLIKLATAGVSVATAIALWPVLPRALAVPSPAELEFEIRERQRAEAELRLSHDQLEQRVLERTLALERAVRELARSNRELEEFAHVVSHDLKGPLRRLSSVSTWFQSDFRGQLPEEARAQLDLLRARVQEMERMIDDILEHAELTLGEPRLEPIDPHAVVRRAVEALGPLDEASVQIRVQDRLPYLVADRAQLERVFQNLIGNAVRHHGRDKVRIEVGGRDLDDRVELWVRDDGIGIDRRHHQRIFRMFQSIQGRDGTGVGLALVKRVVERQGGAITVQSRSGGPTTFRFWLPKTPVEACGLGS